MAKEELKNILKMHEAWLDGDPDGVRLDLSSSCLFQEDLRDSSMQNAKLYRSDLRLSDLRRSDLRNSDLNKANLEYSKLAKTDFRRATLAYANLHGSDLSDADLTGANLRGAVLSGANLSGAKGLISSCDYMKKNFKCTESGYIAYKTFGEQFEPPQKWNIAPGSVIEENVDSSRTMLCGCGINVASWEWVISHTLGDIWKVLIRWEWLPGVVVPYNTDGKIRCEKVELIEIVERKEKT